MLESPIPQYLAVVQSFYKGRQNVMFRTTIAVTLALLLILAVGSTAAAQSDAAAKTIPATMCGNAEQCGDNPCTRTWFEVQWTAPEKEPHSYRVSWAVVGKNWRGKNKSNTRRAGNATVKGATEYTIRGVAVRPKDVLNVRVRAIYKREKNGPWNCCLRFPRADGYDWLAGPSG